MLCLYGIYFNCCECRIFGLSKRLCVVYAVLFCILIRLDLARIAIGLQFLSHLAGRSRQARNQYRHPESVLEPTGLLDNGHEGLCCQVGRQQRPRFFDFWVGVAERGFEAFGGSRSMGKFCHWALPSL